MLERPDLLINVRSAIKMINVLQDPHIISLLWILAMNSSRIFNKAKPLLRTHQQISVSSPKAVLRRGGI